MKGMIFLIVCVGIVAQTGIAAEEANDRDYYTAAVYEHRRRGHHQNDPMRQFIEINLEAYETAASVAAEHNVDILVFPEYGLFPGRFREAYHNDAQYVPDPHSEIWNPCLEPYRYENSYILVNLSCMANRHNMVIVANLVSKVTCNSDSDDRCPDDGMYMYVTNVAFNRSGSIIGRYRNLHLYHGTFFNAPSEPEYTVFETDFGTFGTFICLDIEWKEAVELVEKKNPDAVVYTTLWFEFLRPGMTAVNTQQSWANKNNVTMIASNRQHPWTGSMGSGIYLGATRISNYIYETDGRSRLLISKVPRREVTPPDDYPPPTVIKFDDNKPQNGNTIDSGVCSRKVLGQASNIQDFRCWDSDLTNFTLQRIEGQDGKVEACDGGLCCTAEFQSQSVEETYYLAAYNGTYTLRDKYHWWLEICLFVRCDVYNDTECSIFPTQSRTVFTKLTMDGNFTTPYVYPGVTVSGLKMLPIHKWSHTDHSLSLRTSDDKLLFATLYGRAYERDP